MLTGMPISISLGLTVLSFLFFLTEVPIESVALKLFTGIEKFEIMAIPFFILAGNFLTHGGVAKRMIRFATSMVGHWHGGLGLGGVVACALFAAVSGSCPATVVAIGSILLPAMVKAGFPVRFGAGVITTSGALGILIPPSIVMVMYSVSTNTSIGALFMAGVMPGLVLAVDAVASPPGTARAASNYPRKERRAPWARALEGLPRVDLGPAADRRRDGRHLLGHLHADRGRRDERGLRLRRRRLRLQGPEAEGRAQDAAGQSANMSAMLLYIITNAILFSFLLTHENIPQAMADWLIGSGLGVIGFLLVVNLLLLVDGQLHGAVVDHPDHGADPVSRSP